MTLTRLPHFQQFSYSSRNLFVTYLLSSLSFFLFPPLLFRCQLFICVAFVLGVGVFSFSLVSVLITQVCDIKIVSNLTSDFYSIFKADFGENSEKIPSRTVISQSARLVLSFSIFLINSSVL